VAYTPRGGGMDLRVMSPNLAEITARVRAAGSDRTIVRELEREINDAARPIRPEVRANVRTVLPAGGGLNEWVARSAARVKGIRGPRVAGVHLSWSRRSLAGASNLNAIDRGRVRHPPPRRRSGRWYNQPVPPKSISSVVKRHQPAFEQAVKDAVNTAMRKVGLS